ncbi:MAG: GAF domain-containing protein, partial [Anaerolineaceae bacterium]|nr:GAF domain-containing protein [Anaerolineaceae bacterium]
NWEYDVEKDIFTFNDNFYAIFHTTAEREGGYQLSSAQYAQRLVHPEDVPVVGSAIEKALASTDRHYSTQLEHRVIYADGGIGYISVIVHIDRDENGRILRYYGANQDITAQKLIELALSKEQERLSEALQNAKMGYWEYDVPTGIYTFNDQFYSIYHTNVEEQGGYTMSAQDYSQRFTMPKEDGPVVFAEIQKALETTDPNYSKTIVHRFIRSDGTEGYLTVRFHILKDSEGRTIKFVGANQDTTESKLAELALARNANELATVAEISTAVSTNLNPEEMVQTVVDLTKERFGLYHAHIYLLDADGDSLTLAAGAGEVGKLMVAQGWQIPLEREQSLVARSVRNRQGVIINDVRSEPGFMPNELLPNTRAEMAVPMLVGDTLIGVLDVQADVVERFTDEDVRIMTTLSAQVGVALQNSRQFAQVQQQEQLVSTLYQASSAINTAHTYDDILNALRTYTIAGRGAHGVSFSLFDRPWTDKQTPEWINAIAYYNNAELLPPELIPSHYSIKDFPAISTTLSKDHITIFDDIENSSIMDDNARALYSKVFKAKSTFFAPLVVAGQWIGYINTLYPDLINFSEQDVQLLTSLTGQIGVAVQNLRTSEQIEAALESLHQNDARLSEALDIAKLANWEYDVEKDIFTFNDNFYAIFHTTAEREGGYQLSSAQYAQRLVHPED